MIKVFLVEDEIVMREGIKNNINWSQEGLEFVGDASDGELAYPLIQKTQPDILITDIKMPFMDGLELSRLVKAEMPDIKILILSGYDEFEYAKEAIKIGITDYLVKPIAAAKLLEEVKKVAEIVIEEQQQKEFLQTFEQERLENRQLAVQKFFRSLVSGKKSVSEALKEGRELGIDLAAEAYNIAMLQLFTNGEKEGYSETQTKVIAEMKALAGSRQDVLMAELGLDSWSFLVKENGENPLEETLETFLGGLEEIMTNHEGMEYFIGVGSKVERLSELNHCFEEASRAFSYRYLKKRNQIVFSGQEMQGDSVDEELKLSSLKLEKLDRKSIERFLKTGLRGEAVYFIDEYFASLGERNVQSLLFRQYVTMDMYFAAVAMLEQIGYGSEELVERCGDFQQMSSMFSTVEQTKEYLVKVLETVIDFRENVSSKKYHSLLEEAKAYIEQNFDNEEISLNTVAATVNLSPNHFSTIFSQEMGKTFIEFLTEVRMEKAKELLRTTSMKMAEIAFLVGYKDPHYFSYLFKKTQECTPREFRAKG